MSDRNELEVAWAAGLFEGEGCIAVYQREHGAKIQPQLRLGMTDRDVVERFARIIGFGNIHEAKPGTGSDKPCPTWVIYEAEKVREVLALFMPYFGKRRRAKAREVLTQIAGVQSHFAKTTHCPRGHAYEGDNLVLEPFVGKNGKSYVARRCKACRAEQSRERARKRLGVTPERYRV